MVSRVDRRRIALLILVVGVFLGGCSAFPGGSGTATPGADDSAPPAETRSDDAPPESDVHPWAGETVRVAIEHTVPGDREVRPLVRDALDTWNGTRVAGGRVSFTLVDGTEADLELSVPPRITDCAGDVTSFTFRFCMPTIGPEHTTEGGVNGSIAGLYDDETFVAVAEGALANLLDREPEAADAYPPARYTYTDPWPDSSPVVVNVSTPGNESRSLTPLVREAVAWWDSRPGTQRDYSVEFVVRPNAPDADLQVRLVDEIEACGVESDADPVGCADLLNEDSIADGATVRVEAGYTPDSTLQILKHEFGHIHGREHGETPTGVMEPGTDKHEWPAPNATERDLPWNSSDLAVSLETGPAVEAGTAWDDIQPALEFYEDGAGGWLAAPVTFTRVDDPAQADITVTVVEDNVCEFEQGGVCRVDRKGENFDSDPAIEVYTSASMTIADVDGDERAWFAGFGLAYALGAPNQSAMPAPLQDIDNADTQWWTAG